LLLRAWLGKSEAGKEEQKEECLPLESWHKRGIVREDRVIE
jgi:hypothetical protein